VSRDPQADETSTTQTQSTIGDSSSGEGAAQVFTGGRHVTDSPVVRDADVTVTSSQVREDGVDATVNGSLSE